MVEILSRGLLEPSVVRLQAILALLQVLPASSWVQHHVRLQTTQLPERLVVLVQVVLMLFLGLLFSASPLLSALVLLLPCPRAQ